MYPAWSKIALTAGLIASATAQTYSECNPMKKSCDPNDGLSKSSYSIDFTKGADDDNWEFTGHGEVKYGDEGAEFTVAKKNDSPTLQSKWYMLFGRLEVHLKAAPGTGIVSSVVFLSDVLDEVDWEWLGGSGGEVQTNYYGKASTDNTQSATFPVADTQSEFHNYTVHWTKDSCEWIINNKVVRTLKYADAQGGETYPQTPMRVKFGIWAGGDPDNAEGTIEWAGGETDYSAGPYTMTVQKVMIENLNPAESYTYSDKSGSYESIEFDKKDDGGDDDSEDDDKDSSSASETASETGSETGSETTMATATKTDSDSDSDASATASDDSTDFKNNKAAATSGADATSAESSASATADSSENGAAGNWPKMWLALGAFGAAMAMM